MPDPVGTTIHELPPLAIASVRVENGLSGLDETDRFFVLVHAVALLMLRFRDPGMASVSFVGHVLSEMNMLTTTTPSNSQGAA